MTLRDRCNPNEIGGCVKIWGPFKTNAAGSQFGFVIILDSFVRLPVEGLACEFEIGGIM